LNIDSRVNIDLKEEREEEEEREGVFKVLWIRCEEQSRRNQ